MVGTNYQQLHRLLNLYEIEGPTAVAVINLVYELLCVTLTVIKVLGAYRDTQNVYIRNPLSRLLLLNGGW